MHFLAADSFVQCPVPKAGDLVVIHGQAQPSHKLKQNNQTKLILAQEGWPCWLQAYQKLSEVCHIEIQTDWNQNLATEMDYRSGGPFVFSQYQQQASILAIHATGVKYGG